MRNLVHRLMDAPDYFHFFGLDPRLTLDLADLETRFYRLSRKLHPDRHAQAAPAERERSLEASAILNDAYRTLRDPVARAEYLLKRQGFKPTKEVPAELLDEVFELNLALEELRAGDASVRPRLQAARGRFRALLAESDAALQRLFADYDQAPGPATLGPIRAALNRRKYIFNLVQQVESESSS
ncbi:MAG: Fe-S protein assembly co-chaperone HscB [Bryobacteraceae bacterium]